MKNLSIILFGLSCLFFKSANAFIAGDVVVVVSSFNVKPFVNGVCLDDSVSSFCPNDEFSIINIKDGIVRVKKTGVGDYCPNYAVEDRIYCFAESILNDAAMCVLKSDQKSVKLNGYLTALTVPFKFDPQTFKLFPSGQIGGFGGFQFTFKDRDLELGLGGILGASTIPLNDANSSEAGDIKSVGGVTLGGGFQVNIWRGFSFGAFYAWDLYNVDNTKYSRDWISFGIGYNFFTTNKDQTFKKQE